MVCFDFRKHERQFFGDGSDGVESAPMTDTDKLYEKPYKQPLYGKSYIDTDKLKRLAEDLQGAVDQQDEYFLNTENCQSILSLIAENERMKAERDEAVALVRKWREASFDILKAECRRETRAFLARIDQ